MAYLTIKNVQVQDVRTLPQAFEPRILGMWFSRWDYVSTDIRFHVAIAEPPHELTLLAPGTNTPRDDVLEPYLVSLMAGSVLLVALDRRMASYVHGAWYLRKLGGAWRQVVIPNDAEHEAMEALAVMETLRR